MLPYNCQFFGFEVFFQFNACNVALTGASKIQN